MKQRPPIRRDASNPSTLLARALQRQQSGKLDEAERLYEAVLATQPANFEALRRQGILRYQQGRFGEALQSFGAALRAAPAHPAAWCVFG
ncbi:MAG: tetratricopeptide repeat protein, partial [Roseiarcus sp.]